MTRLYSNRAMAPKKSKKRGKAASDSESDEESVQLSEVSDAEESVVVEDVTDDEDDKLDSSSDEDHEPEYTEANVASEAEFREEGKEDDEDADCFYVQALEEEAEVQVAKKTTKKVPNEDRMTTRKLTQYEMVRVLGDRAKQISMNAKVMIKNMEGMSPLEIAIEELRHKVIPFKIRRPMPNGTYEEWKISELEVDVDMLKN
jgi:DNA-directed RNA polymerase subunit K/omega